jgi:hypothetical protein
MNFEELFGNDNLFDEGDEFEGMMDFEKEEIAERKREVCRALLCMLQQSKSDGDIKGTKVNQENLMRMNKANLMAVRLFAKNAQDLQFSLPEQDMSYVQSYITCDSFYFENEKAKNKKLFEEFLTLVDDFGVGAIDSKTIQISFSVNDVWEE